MKQTRILALKLSVLLALTALPGCRLLAAATGGCAPLLDVEVRTLDGKENVKLCEAYRDKVVLVVNTASKCAFTDQYGSLEKLYDEYRERGLVVLGFPSNDFGGQEPGSEREIRSFCRATYGVRFPMFAKSSVTARHADPLFDKLAAASGHYPRWNFHKYLIDRNGELVGDYASAFDPLQAPLLDDIERELAK
jgi:glutathione peroxidase